jgi:ubiquitin C-terminal hydrolase
MAWNLADYIELDCSFRGTKPYAYCVPQAIIGNEAIPLGFILTPSECNETYDWWFTDLQNANPNTVIHKKIILSDEGTALIHFGNNISIQGASKHFFCHRHLIEKFGANGFLGALVQQALATECEAAYRELRPQLLADAAQFLADGKIKQKAYDKFLAFLSKDFPHGIWHRAGDGVARCSNHAESFHAQINRRIKGLRGLVRRLAVIVKYINEKYEHYHTCPRVQVGRTINILIGYGVSTSTFCWNRDCLAFQANMQRRFRLNTFPCRHWARHWKDNFQDNEIRQRPLPPCRPLVKYAQLVVEEHRLFPIQLTSQKFTRYRKQRRHHQAPREDVVDEDVATHAPDVMGPVHDQCIKTIPGYYSARKVVMGVKFIADRRGVPPDVTAISYWILDNWIKCYGSLIEGKAPEHQRAVIACFTSYWWSWASDTTKITEAPPAFTEGVTTFGAHDANSTSHFSGQAITIGLPQAITPPGPQAITLPRPQPTPTDPHIVSGSHLSADLTGFREVHALPDARQSPDPPRHGAFNLGGHILPFNFLAVTGHLGNSSPSPSSAGDPNIPMGLDNFGTNCYLNAGLQCLTHIRQLRERFRTTNELVLQPISKAYRILQVALEQRSELTVRQIVAQLFNSYAHFLSQEDMTEWLDFFLSSLHRELAGIPSRNNDYPPETGSFIPEIFCGIQRTNHTCARCGQTRTIRSACYSLQLPLPCTSTVSLDDCLARFAAPMPFDAANTYTCGTCRTLVPGSIMQVCLGWPAPVLIISLKRFSSKVDRPVKLNTTVTFPETLELPPEILGCSDTASVFYDLIAVAEHQGENASSGHYVAYVRNGINWYLCNDLFVSQVSVRDVLSAQAYVLFYERRDSDPVSF